MEVDTVKMVGGVGANSGPIKNRKIYFRTTAKTKGEGTVIVPVRKEATEGTTPDRA